MREFSKIDITAKLNNRDLYGLEKLQELVTKSIQEISNMVLEQDRLLIRSLPAADVDMYVNVETYFVLNDYLFWLDEEQAHLHQRFNCPICAKKHRAHFLIDSLIKRWEAQGKKKRYEEAVRFRADAMDKGRNLN